MGKLLPLPYPGQSMDEYREQLVNFKKIGDIEYSLGYTISVRTFPPINLSYILFACIFSKHHCTLLATPVAVYSALAK